MYSPCRHDLAGMCWLLLRRLLAPGHRLLDATPRAGVRTRALAAHRQIAAMPDTAVAVDLDQPLDVHVHFAAKFALDLKVAVDELAQACDLVLGQILHPRVGAHPRRGEDTL